MIDTICALSTPRGLSALALIRVSGPGVSALIASQVGVALEERRATLVRLKDNSGHWIDEVVATYFAGPRSYTGEDMLEIACHGNEVIVNKIVSEIVSRETFRLAEPGEFSQRALANEKLSLYDIEALDRVYSARTVEAASAAIRRKIEGPGQEIANLRENLAEVLVGIQSQLDFSEEEVGPGDRKAMVSRLENILRTLASWLQRFEVQKSLFQRPHIVLVGRPNAGKSSLFNKLVGFERAIVHEKPGTTRDTIESEISRGGASFLLVDTAGIRSDSEEIEALGISRTIEASKNADTIVWVSDSFEAPPEWLDKERLICIRSKADLSGSAPCSHGAQMIDGLDSKQGWLEVSALSGLGLETLEAKLFKSPAFDHDSSIISERQADLVRKANASIKKARSLVADGHFLDLSAEAVLEAGRFLGNIVEGIEPDETLRSIFSRFCIGK